MLTLLTTAPSQVPADWWTYLASAGTPGILAICVIAFAKGWVVPGGQYREVCDQRDKALEKVFELAESAQRAIEAVERKIVP